MRELMEEEKRAVSGGNGFFPGVLAISGAYNFGKFLGTGINKAVQDTTGKSVGQNLYKLMNPGP